jgi:hypothetical protein
MVIAISAFEFIGDGRRGVVDEGYVKIWKCADLKSEIE